jgi:hypothetical protein
LSILNLETTEWAAILCESNLALEIDSKVHEPLIVGSSS